MSVFVERSQAQSPARRAAPAQTKGAAAPAPQIHAILTQLMQGILFPSANVFFAAQTENPNDVPPAKDPSAATNPLASS
jgi:hypothetical protein